MKYGEALTTGRELEPSDPLLCGEIPFIGCPFMRDVGANPLVRGLVTRGSQEGSGLICRFGGMGSRMLAGGEKVSCGAVEVVGRVGEIPIDGREMAGREGEIPKGEKDIVSAVSGVSSYTTKFP